MKLNYQKLSNQLVFLVVVLICSVLYLAASQIAAARNTVARVESDNVYLFYNANLKQTWDTLQEQFDAAYAVGARFTARGATPEELEAALQQVVQTTGELGTHLSSISPEMLSAWDSVLIDDGRASASETIDLILADQEKFIAAFSDISVAWREKAGFVQRKAAEKNITAVMTDYTKQIKEIQNQFQFFIQEKSQSYIEQQRQKTIRSLIIASVIVAVGVLLSITMIIRIRREFEVTVAAARQIADGDIQTELVVGQRQDEMSNVKRSLKSLVEKLKDIFDSVFRLTDDLDESTDKLVADNNSRLQEATAQVHELEQLVGVVTQLEAYSEEVSLFASNSIENADEALAASDETSETVNKTVTSIEALSSEVNNAVDEIKALEESTVEISSVLTVIQSIAEQTNLLALNAAIEAARAGEQGRGFAVVADEVRNLAKRTQDSTNEIQATIEGLTSGTQRVVQTITQSQSNTRESVEWINRTGEVIKDIRHSVESIRESTTQTVEKLELQTGSLSEISSSVGNIRQLAQDNSTRAEQSLELADQLSNLSSGLQSSISYFRKN